MAAAGWVWRSTKSNNDITHRNRGSPSWICCNNKPLTHRTSSWSALFSSFRTDLAYFLCLNIFSFYFRQLPFCCSVTAAHTLCGVGKTTEVLQINQVVLVYLLVKYLTRRLKVPPKTFLDLLTPTFQVEGWWFVLTTNFANKHSPFPRNSDVLHTPQNSVP